MGGESANETEQTEEKDRQATVLELFLDLAFVFSIAQITTFIAGNETNTGILKGVLLAWLVWWLWITTLQGLDAWKTLETRKAWLSYGPPALLAPVVLMAGSLVDGNARIIT